LSKLVIVFKNL